AMPSKMLLDKKILLRPLLDVPREAILAYARAQRLRWIEDESNLDEALTRNFIRRRVGPLLASRFPRWRESLARAARHFGEREVSANRLLRQFLAARGLRAPSEAKLIEMLKQLGGRGAELRHDGVQLRAYRGKVFVSDDDGGKSKPFAPIVWQGERRLELDALGGELRFRRARGKGLVISGENRLEIRLRSGGERLQPDSP